MRRYQLHWSADEPTIWIRGRIGPDDVSAAALRRSLAELRDEPELNIRIASGGGECPEGLALYTLLREAERPIHVTVHQASSMAAIVAMAGHRISIVEGGTFLLHDAAQLPEQVAAMAAELQDARATAIGFRSIARQLSRVDALHLDIFARRTGRSRNEIAMLSASSTTLDAHEAVRLGFADEVIPCP